MRCSCISPNLYFYFGNVKKKAGSFFLFDIDDDDCTTSIFFNLHARRTCVASFENFMRFDQMVFNNNNMHYMNACMFAFRCEKKLIYAYVT